MSLETLPIEIVVDQILSAQSNADLCSVRLVSRTLCRLADDASIWRKRSMRKFKLPLHVALRVRDWRALYARLATRADASSPLELWTCGRNAEGRLGVDVARLPEKVKQLVALQQGAPFPLKVQWHKARIWNNRDDEWDESNYLKTSEDAEDEEEDRKEDERLERKRQGKLGEDEEEDEWSDEEDEDDDGESTGSYEDFFMGHVSGKAEKAHRDESETYKSVQPVDVGHPVELHAAGSMFCALTSTGNVLDWGQLRTKGTAHSWKAHAGKPSILGLGPEKALAVTCGETIVVMTEHFNLWQWHHALAPIGLEDTYGMNDDVKFNVNTFYQMCLQRSVDQLISGGDFTAILTHAPHREEKRFNDDPYPYKDLASIPHRVGIDSGIYVWYTRWTESGLDDGVEDAQALQEAHPGIYSEVLEGCYYKSSYAIRLPDLPDPPADLAASLLSASAIGQVDAQEAIAHPSHKYIKRIAGGVNYLYALTASGLLYRLCVKRPTLRGETPKKLLFAADIMQGRNSLHHDFYTSKKKAWTLLRGFCDPQMILRAGGETWNVPGKQGLVKPSTRITDISARHDTFVAYSLEAGASDVDAASEEPQGGVTLIGYADATTDTLPTVKPWLQGTGIVKVERGETHWGALDNRGRLRTWGASSAGARGTWDAYPPSNEGYKVPLKTIVERLAAGYRRVELRLKEVQAAIKKGTYKSALTEAQEVALHERCKLRHTPEKEEEPNVVSFFDFDENAESRERIVMDFAMADSHTGALTIDALE